MTQRQRTAELKRQLSLAEDNELVAEQNLKVAKNNVAKIKAELMSEGITKREKKQILSNEAIMRIEASI